MLDFSSLSHTGLFFNQTTPIFTAMSRVCQLTGRGTQTGNKISHSKRHTRRTFAINLQTKRIGGMKLRLSTRAIRTLAKATA